MQNVFVIMTVFHISNYIAFTLRDKILVSALKIAENFYLHHFACK